MINVPKIMMPIIKSETIIALEGPSYCGKTTIASELRKYLSVSRTGSVYFLPDYMVVAGGMVRVPSLLEDTAEDELARFKFFHQLDEKRFAPAIKSSAQGLIVAERSIHTLLAHQFAIEQMLGLSTFECACEIALSSPRSYWPGHVIYINVIQSVLNKRYKQRGTFTHNIFCNPLYNRHFSTYFLDSLGPSRSQNVVDGNLPVSDVLCRILAIIQDKGI